MPPEDLSCQFEYKNIWDRPGTHLDMQVEVTKAGMKEYTSVDLEESCVGGLKVDRDAFWEMI